MRQKVTILVLDDHPVVRQGVVAMIQAYGEGFHVVGEACSPDEGLAKAAALRPDVVVTDLIFNGSSRNGIDVIRELQMQGVPSRCVLITANMQGHYMVEAFKAGAKAFLYKESDAREYVKAIEAAFEGMTYFPPELPQELDRWSRLPRLTPSEERLMPYVAKGLTSKEIAREYNHLDSPKVIEPRTIDQHKSNIKQKFAIDSMGGLVAFAIKYCDDNNLDYRNLQIQAKRSLLGF
ncbi:response regulator transcription factor [Rhodoferax sp. GW822-FHT02A01]|uniref:response regulator transcription factor n=1 Tax=Rhodoferax sp. GW822-FHT02A01 TaxID=3141537 RepID=UPI00315DFBEF